MLTPDNRHWRRVEELTEEQMMGRLLDPEFARRMEYVQGADFFPVR